MDARPGLLALFGSGETSPAGRRVHEHVFERLRRPGGGALLDTPARFATEASAAAIALGRCALPVYEIFKAGHDPAWIDGLDLLGQHGFELAIVPHWNNAEGGRDFDSSFCFMGAQRFEALRAQLPSACVVLG